jgi:hypothetical protein
VQGRLARFQQQLRERGRLQAHWLDWQYDRIEPLRETARVAAEVKQRLAQVVPAAGRQRGTHHRTPLPASGRHYPGAQRFLNISIRLHG